MVLSVVYVCRHCGREVEERVYDDSGRHWFHKYYTRVTEDSGYTTWVRACASNTVAEP